MQSDLERAIQQYRDALLANESRATLAIANAYKATRARLVKRIEDLADSIAEDGAEFTPSQVLRWQRAKTLLRQVEAEMASLATASSQPIQTAQAAAVEMAGEQAKGLALATAQSAGADAIAATIEATWNRLNTGAAEQMVGRMSDGSPLSGWLDQFGAKVGVLIADELRSAAALGTNPRDVARSLAGKLDVSAARLLNMSRTEILGAQRAAAMKTLQDNADLCDGWIWIGARQPGRTCLACLSLQGMFFPLTVAFQASHNSCRCSSRPSVKGVDSNRLPTGEQWFNAQPEAVRRDMIPKALWDDYQSGAIVLSDFRHLHEDDQWGPSYREATIPQALANAKRRVRGFGDGVPKKRKVADSKPGMPEAFPRIAANRSPNDVRDNSEAISPPRKMGLQQRHWEDHSRRASIPKSLFEVMRSELDTLFVPKNIVEKIEEAHGGDIGFFDNLSNVLSQWKYAGFSPLHKDRLEVYARIDGIWVTIVIASSQEFETPVLITLHRIKERKVNNRIAKGYLVSRGEKE